MSPSTAPVQKAPSVVTVIAQAQGPTTSRIRAKPQVQPSPCIQAALRSQIHSAIRVSAATRGPMGPLSRIDAAIPAQNTARVPTPAIASPLPAA